MIAPPRNRREKPLNNRELADALCEISPVLREARMAHVKTFGTLVPHVFMSEVLARVGWCFRAQAAKTVASCQEEVAGILELLERGMASGDRETRNVIAISFSGDAELEPFFSQLEPLLGPRMRAQMQGA